MGSFSSKLINFNPYIKQVPVEEYANVLMQKQGQYDEGVKTANNYLESIAGLDVVHPEQKNYLAQRYSQLESEMNKVAGEDFSNKQLVNQIGSLASTITKDPIIQNAVQSTAKYKFSLAQLQKAKSEGKSSVENEWDFQNQVNGWMNNADPRSSFNGEYRPYVDVRKKILDVINKDVPETERITQVPWVTDANGTPVLKDGNIQIAPAMMETISKGRNPQAIISGVMSALDNNDIAQLGIEGRYHFQGQDANALKETVDKSYKAKLGFYTDKLDDLDNKKRLNPQDQNYQSRIDDEISAVEKQAETLQKRYPESIKALENNPEGFKSTFYTENYLEQIGNAFSYPSKESHKYESNPFQAQVNWEKDFNFKVQKQFDDLNMERLKISLAKDKAKKDEESNSNLVKNPIYSPDPQAEQPTIEVFKTEIEQDQASLDALQNEMLESLYRGMDKEKAEAKLLELQKGNEEGSAEPKVAEYFKATEKLKGRLDNKKATLLKITDEADKQFSLKEVFKGKNGLKVGDVFYTPEELFIFQQKMKGAVNTTIGQGMGGAFYNSTKFDENKASKGLSTKEQRLYDAYRKSWNSPEAMTPVDKAIMTNMRGIIGEVDPKAQEAVEEKAKFVNKRLAEVLPEYIPEDYIVPAEKTETRYFAKSQVDLLLGNAEKTNKSLGLSPNFDFDVAKKVNSEPETTYGVHRKGNSIFLTLSNPKEKKQYIPISPKNAGQMFPDKFNRPFDQIQETLRATENRSTNVRGRGDGSASDYATAYFYKQDFPSVSKYGVRGDVEPTVTGGYQFRLYAFDPIKKTWVTKPLPKVFYNQDDLLQVQNQIGDLAIEQLFGIKN